MLVYSGLGRFATDSWVILDQLSCAVLRTAAAGAWVRLRSRFASRRALPAYAAIISQVLRQSY